jgi:hypothetical protein
MLLAWRLLSLGSRAAKDSDQTGGKEFLHDMIERKEGSLGKELPKGS